ncbi:MAG: isocitrate/isopropylmalate family dehydrogenase, partial [Burkholderiales bacterium]
MNRFDIAVIPGDGIGREVVPAGCKILDTVAEAHGGFRLRYKSYPWSCAWYLKHGKMMPDDGLKRIGDSDAIFLGAVGFPGVADHIS